MADPSHDLNVFLSDSAPPKLPLGLLCVIGRWVAGPLRGFRRCASPSNSVESTIGVREQGECCLRVAEPGGEHLGAVKYLCWCLKGEGGGE